MGLQDRRRRRIHCATCFWWPPNYVLNRSIIHQVIFFTELEVPPKKLGRTVSTEEYSTIRQTTELNHPPEINIRAEDNVAGSYFIETLTEATSKHFYDVLGLLL